MKPRVPRKPRSRRASPSDAMFDVLGLGCTAVDDLVYVSGYPPADTKLQVNRRERHCGGLTATALVAAARLGCRAAYAGTLGDDPDSAFVRETFAREGVDTRHVVRRRGARPVRSVIVVDESAGTRTILYDVRDANGAHLRLPARDLIERSRVLLVDRFGVPGMIRAARIARSAGRAVVADLEYRQLPRFAELQALADHLIVSEGFACELTGAADAAEAVTRLWRDDRAVVVVTGGERGCWWRDEASPEPQHLPAFRVAAVDTTGCGDVFHGAYAAALAKGLPLAERLRVAAAAAALKATQPGGQRGIPTWQGLQRFLRRVEC